MTTGPAGRRPVMRRAGAALGQRVRELRVHAQRWAQPPDRPRAVFLLSSGASALLRGEHVARALRRLGWRTAAVPMVLHPMRQRRILERERPDVVVFQQLFNPMNRPGLHPGRRCVLDLDDADFLNPAWAGLLEASCRGCAAVVAGSRFVARWCEERNPSTWVIWTGTPVPRRPTVKNARRGPVVAWAANRPLSFRAEIAMLNRVLVALRRRCDFEFLMVGADDVAAVRSALGPSIAAGVRCTIEPPMRYERLIRRLEAAAVGLNPLCYDENPYSRGKSFGKVLAYLSAEVAIVTSDGVDHPLFFRDGENGVMLHGEAGWADRIAELLGDPAKRQRVVDAARLDFIDKLSTEAMARRYDAVLRSVIGSGAREEEGLGVGGAGRGRVTTDEHG